VAIATSQEIGKFLTYFTKLFGKILQLFSLSVLVVAIAANQEIAKFLTDFSRILVKDLTVGSQCFMEAFSWMSEFNTDLFCNFFTLKWHQKNKKTFLSVFLRLGFDE
jgi:hypothetical protein